MDSNLGATFNQSVQFELYYIKYTFFFSIGILMWNAQRIMMLEIWNCIRIINNNCYYLLKMLAFREAGSTADHDDGGGYMPGLWIMLREVWMNCVNWADA